MMTDLTDIFRKTIAVDYYGRLRDSEITTLQKRVVRWHKDRFPEAEAHHVALKAMAELGEVADSFLHDEGVNSATGEAGDGVLGEAADVVIVLMTLVGRWMGDDLLTAVEKKLSILETPGAHKASRRES